MIPLLGPGVQIVDESTREPERMAERGAHVEFTGRKVESHAKGYGAYPVAERSVSS